jgi:hypothetical protein
MATAGPSRGLSWPHPPSHVAPHRTDCPTTARYKEAVKECNLALEVQPQSVIALKRRASAYEQQGLFKQALTDITKVNGSEGASAETKEAEKRLKDIMAGRNKPNVAANGAAVRATQRPATRPSQGTPFAAKCTFKGETRLVHISVNVTYVDLLEQVKNKFPEAGNCPSHQLQPTPHCCCGG